MSVAGSCLAALAVALAAPSPAGSPTPSFNPVTTPTALEFAAAIKREAAGDLTGAAAALELLGHAHPSDPYADDALYEAAQLYDERLEKPDQARRLYAEIVARYPDSRLARRAKHRVEDLSRALGSGADLLVTYQRILADGAHLERAVPAMVAFVQAHPEFALADQARFWIGERLAELGRYAEADQRLAEIDRGDLVERAQAARARIAILRGHPFVARAIFTYLLRSTDPLMRATAKEGLERVDVSVDYDVILAVALAVLALWLLWIVVDGRGGGWQLPGEIYYYLPVALLFVLAAATENRAVAQATICIAVGGALLTWLSARATRGRMIRRGISRSGSVARALLVGLSALSLCYVALFYAGLLDLIWATFRFGPDR